MSFDLQSYFISRLNEFHRLHLSRQQGVLTDICQSLPNLTHQSNNILCSVVAKSQCTVNLLTIVYLGNHLSLMDKSIVGMFEKRPAHTQTKLKAKAKIVVLSFCL